MNSPKKPIHVGINGRTFIEDEPGGAVQTAKELTHGLTRLDNMQVSIFGHEDLRSEFKNTIKTYLYANRSPYYGVIWERTILPILAERCGVDVLFCPNANAPLHSTPFPVVTCIHDVSAQEDWSSTIHGLYREITVPKTARQSDHLITVSKFSKSEIVSKLEIDPERISVVHNGISDWFLNDEPGDPINVPDKYILYVGALNPRKNVAGLISAYRRVQTQLDHDLVLTGPRNKDIFKSLNVVEEENIHRTGFVSQKELKYLYNKADVFAYPSFYEGFGLPPLEAAACETPVVTSQTGAIPDILGDAARYVNPKDIDDIGTGLVWAASNPKSKQSAKLAKKRVQSLTWERATEELCSVLISVANQ